MGSEPQAQEKGGGETGVGWILKPSKRYQSLDSPRNSFVYNTVTTDQDIQSYKGEGGGGDGWFLKLEVSCI
jgi:hypothetical protein